MKSILLLAASGFFFSTVANAAVPDSNYQLTCTGVGQNAFSGSVDVTVAKDGSATASMDFDLSYVKRGSGSSDPITGSFETSDMPGEVKILPAESYLVTDATLFTLRQDPKIGPARLKIILELARSNATLDTGDVAYNAFCEKR